MNNDDFLKNVGMFSKMSPKHLKQIAKACRSREYKAGEYIVRQDEEGLGLFIITGGKVEVVKETSEKKELHIATHTTGEFIGEMTIIDGAKRTASVIAKEDTTCLVLTSWDFHAIMKAHPEMALEILPIIVKRFRETNEQLIKLQS
ncbi:MAG: cyclic nucleotide-binding domain-containing protein [Spirochaetales bacterium]|jgi:CRP-like cAMP-binding protein|nr:cyclic nucleotide-binding domain-containing protein [Spirochaetales bacterium]